MGRTAYDEQEQSPKRRKTLCYSTTMDDPPSLLLGQKGLINKREFVRIIVQCLYSLGYNKSASELEFESGVSYKSAKFEWLESQLREAKWNECINTLNAIEDLEDETRALASFLILRQCILEYLSRGYDSLALEVLQKRISALQVGSEEIHKLAYSIISLKELGLNKVDSDNVIGLRQRLLSELERLLPPSISLPERRLEHLVEMALINQKNCCIYHNSSDPVSLYEDHCCGSDQIPSETIQKLTCHNNEVWFVQFSNNGEYLASSSSDCTAIIWKVSENDEVTWKHTLSGHQKPVSFVAWSPDDTMLLTCGTGEVVKLWDVETGTCKRTFGDQGSIISSCAWFPDSKLVICGSADPEKCISMWDTDGKELKAWKGPRMPKVLDLAVTPDGKYEISICSEKEIHILKVGTNDEYVIHEDHSITSLSVSGDGNFLIVNLNSQEIHLWHVTEKWDKPLKYTGHKQGKYVIRSCFGGVDCMFIASGSENSQVYIWSRQRCEPIKVLSGHSMTVNCVSWNPKRPKMLASASDDQTIRIWGASRRTKKT